MKFTRAFTSILSTKLPETRDFYTTLFDYAVLYDSDWFIQLGNPDNEAQELGILQQDHAIVPEGFRANAQGFYLTYVVEDVDKLYATAQEAGLDIIQAPENTDYGQRRMLLRDPNGVLVDCSTPYPRSE